MGNPTTAPLEPITAGDGTQWKALYNNSADDITVSVTVMGEGGTHSYDMVITPRLLVPNDCIVTAVSGGTIYGYRNI